MEWSGQDRISDRVRVIELMMLTCRVKLWHLTSATVEEVLAEGRNLWSGCIRKLEMSLTEGLGSRAGQPF